MIRSLFERVVLFALPFVAYGVWLLLARLRPPAPVRPHPWLWLSAAGLVLVAASLFVWRFAGGEPTTGTYVAPQMVNGKIVPGYVIPAPRKKTQ